jgi:cell wall-associated NlpC family hydrolase
MKRRIVAASAPLKRLPRADAPYDSELIRGEVFTVFEEAGEGWSWGQNEADSYVGHVPGEALGPLEPAPTHRVSALRTFVYPGPDLRLPALEILSLGARLTLAGEVETRGTLYRPIAAGRGAVVAAHVVPAEAPRAADPVAVAERFLETPYRWGGRTSIGLDCSALVQLALAEAGIAAPRDSDQQERMVGRPVEGGIDGALQRGDLIFWKGHVGMLRDAGEMIHASGHHMAVVSEPLREALARIERTGGRPTSVRRPALPQST